MGKLVTFWSPYQGKAKVTATMCAVAGAFGILYPELDVALSHTSPDDMSLEEKLEFRNSLEERKELYKKTGMAAVTLYYMQAVLTSERVRNSAVPLLMESLYLYPYVEKKEKMDKLPFFLMTEELKKEFDVVFLDLKSGRNDESLQFMQKADFIVVVLPQDVSYWNHFCAEAMECLEGRRFCILLGGYLEKSRYSATYYTRKIRGKTRCQFAGVIPINVGFMDALSEGNVLDFFLKNQLATKKEENYEFISQAKKTAECLKKSIFFP